METDLVVRSFRAVFELERRVYRIDRLRLNPSGVPVRGIAYLAALELIAVLAGALPPSRWLITPFPWYVRDVAAPVAGAVVLGVLRIDGRPFHLAAESIARLVLEPRHLSGLVGTPNPRSALTPGPMVLLPDGTQPQVRRVRYRGPGAVLVAAPGARARRRGARTAAQLVIPSTHRGRSAAGKVVVVPPGGTVAVVAERSERRG